MDAPPLSEEELNAIYNWVDKIPLSRPKKNITRDFADGVLVAEIVAHFLPKYVELHNYSPANSATQKLYNWNTLNQKVFKKVGFQISKTDVDYCINCVPDAVERVLKVIQVKIDGYLKKEGERKIQKMNMSQNQYEDEMYYNKGYDGRNVSQSYNQKDMDKEIFEKDQTIQELRETIEILELKIKKLEQLVKLKDSKIQTLTSKLAAAGIS